MNIEEKKVTRDDPGLLGLRFGAQIGGKKVSRQALTVPDKAHWLNTLNLDFIRREEHEDNSENQPRGPPAPHHKHAWQLLWACFWLGQCLNPGCPPRLDYAESVPQVLTLLTTKTEMHDRSVAWGDEPCYELN